VNVRLVVFTDLDGTFLDADTYSYAESLPALSKALSLPGAVVLCSSKTRNEIASLRDELRLNHPFIVENGGGIYLPESYFPFLPEGAVSEGRFRKITLGAGIDRLRAALKDTAAKVGTTVRSFGSMSVAEISQHTRLTLPQAAAAAAREFDEPFLIEDGEPAVLIAALEEQGFQVVEGGRFFHLTGRCDKGDAVKLLSSLYRRVNPSVVSAGLGDSANDVSFLKEVDHPVLIRGRDGSWNPKILAEMPGILKSREPGPRGWSEAVEGILGEIEDRR
jgi:mannosyl-3-phosphoglycerate phosphatase